MRVSYYPGCSLHGTAREYAESAKAVCDYLDVDLEELSDWCCCGASSAHSMSDSLSLALPARNLTIAEKMGLEDLVVPCAACFHMLKKAERWLADDDQGMKSFPHQRKVKVTHLLDYLHDNHLSAIKALTKRPLAGLKTVSYYGCLTNRPPHITGSENYEDPQSMDKLMAMLGAESLFWSFKTDCCGGGTILSHPEIVTRLTERLVTMAREAGADAIVTGCPLCHSNLDISQREMYTESDNENWLPIFYFTELVALAFDHPDVSRWLERHLVDPLNLLQGLGLI